MVVIGREQRAMREQRAVIAGMAEMRGSGAVCSTVSRCRGGTGGRSMGCPSIGCRSIGCRSFPMMVGSVVPGLPVLTMLGLPVLRVRLALVCTDVLHRQRLRNRWGKEHQQHGKDTQPCRQVVATRAGQRPLR